ncbi:hypothetical protein GCM10007094_37110 [Pseudovibrio japonicus]|uniref:Glycerophosphoryl diester phosphodiesterase membrane domain-containing protein n=1 Tax=Pseudovibrio japonicus TaxID=366534 RepID=A0ABQ3ES03_9HYPH|nr:hypothetical protein [Pseudovibrio japonicus]GHB44379.1 hypothetical protein GCM10007094_37110 [Pseudovibrio japonicus]
MTSSADIGDHMALGVGAIIGESFSIFLKHLIPVALMALVPSLLSLLASGALIGVDVTLGAAEPEFNASFGFGAWAMATVLQMSFYSLTTALLVQLAYDAKLGRTIQLGRYVAPAIRAAVPITVLSLIAGVLMGVASIALIIPGLWVYAVFSMIAPAVVIERVGFGGLGRSANLTKDYRWPILGALILIGIVVVIFNFIAGFAAELTADSGQFVAALAYLIPTTLGAGLSGVCIALIYARLREIKEGVSVDEIALVFD